MTSSPSPSLTPSPSLSSALTDGHTYTIGITGALGLVGSGIIRAALAAGHSVVALDRQPAGRDNTEAGSEITEEDKRLVGEAVRLANAGVDVGAEGERDGDGNGVIDGPMNVVGRTSDDVGYELGIGRGNGHDTPLGAKARRHRCRYRYRYRQVDLLDYAAYKAAVKEEGCDALVHLAAVYCKHDDEGVFEPGPSQNDVHNKNVAMSYNTLCIAAELGIERIVLASSVNSIGMVFSKRPRFEYFPVDEDHPAYPEDAYSLSKYITEIQSSAFARLHPSLRIATLRFHWVVPTPLCDPAALDARGGSWKDLWGFVTVSKAGEAILRAISVPLTRFPRGHETFFVAARTVCGRVRSEEVARERFPEVRDWRFGAGAGKGEGEGEVKGHGHGDGDGGEGGVGSGHINGNGVERETYANGGAPAPSNWNGNGNGIGNKNGRMSTGEAHENRERNGRDTGEGGNHSQRGPRGNEALISTLKAERMLGWKDEGFFWDG